jgi:MFS transporter, OFA family, oxalate/formate antiporter
MPLYRGWKVALAGAGINFLVGINYTWSIFAAGLVDQKGWTHAQAALPYSFFLFCYAFAMVPAGQGQDYFGPRPVISLGSLFAGGAFAACSYYLDTPFTASLLWGGLLGLGLACCFSSTTPSAMKWFRAERKGTVAGLVVTSTGLAAFVLSPAVQQLVRHSVRDAFLASGLSLFLSILILAQWIANPPVRITDLRDRPVSRRWPASLFDFRLYQLWLMFFLVIGTGVTINAHLVNIMRVQAGFEKGYLVVALFALFNAAGRVAGGFLSDRLGRLRSLGLAYKTIALMLAFLLVVRLPLLLALAVALLALAYGSLYSIFPATVVSFFGDKNFGLYYGVVFTGLGAAGVFPYAAGLLFERQGHYLSAYGLMLATTLAAFLLLRRIKKTSRF